MVALHGFLGRGDDWAAVRGKSGENIRWICPDLFAPDTPDSFSAPAFEGRAWLAGYSFGGRLALRWLNEQPERWHGALLLSVNPGNFQSDGERAARRQHDAAWAEAFRREPWDVVTTKWNAQEIFAGRTALRRDEADFDREKLTAAMQKFSVADQFTDVTRLAGDLVWMAGAEDAKFTSLLEAMRQSGFPGSFFPVAGAGHRLLHEAPDAVAASVGRLVAEG